MGVRADGKERYVIGVDYGTLSDRGVVFSTPRTIGETEVDHALTDIAHGVDGRARLIIRDPSGTRIGMAWNRSCPWLRVHTADKPARLPNRPGLAVEPMTCPPDAFNSDQDLVQLGPGANHEASWRIFAA